MSLKKVLAVALLTAFVGVSVAEATLVSLYSDEDYQYFGAAAAGKRRSQHISPTQSTPNAIGGVGQTSFDSAGLWFTLDAGEAVTGTLSLYAWNTDYTTTIGGASIASTAVNLSGVYDAFVDLSFAAQEADSNDDQYLLSFLVGSVTGADFGLRRSDSNDGGSNNDAYNDSGLKPDREYQVRLNATPEPTTLSLLALGGLALFRKRR